MKTNGAKGNAYGHHNLFIQTFKIRDKDQLRHEKAGPIDNTAEGTPPSFNKKAKLLAYEVFYAQPKK